MNRRHGAFGLAVVFLTCAGAYASSPLNLRPTGSNSVLLNPVHCAAAHDVGRILLTVSNDGLIGNASENADCFTGAPLGPCEYPQGSNHAYLFGACLWIGAVVGEDTLVSTGMDGWTTPGRELNPDSDPLTSVVYRSRIARDPASRAGAVSEQDFLVTYFDTCRTCPGITPDPIDQRPHEPLGLKIIQHSYAWSQALAEDFVLLDYTIRNIGQQTLTQVYLGLFVDGDIYYTGDNGYSGFLDDVTGFLSEADYTLFPDGAGPLDTISLAWLADNDGDLGEVPRERVPYAMAVSMLQAPALPAKVSYNWWLSNWNTQYDFGPQARSSFRLLVSGGGGTPLGDKEKYHYLSNGEMDFDQVRTASIPVNDPIWVPFPDHVKQLALGGEAKFLLSTGPFTLAPGEEVPWSLVFLVGEDLHSDPDNLGHLPDQPDVYLANLDFSDLINNAVMARRIFDNPGVDTDNDGYSGEYAVHDGDTVWYRGDGVPDWRIGSSPLPPAFRVTPVSEGCLVRWNGFITEREIDFVSNEADFEGYSVYLSSTGEQGSFVRVGTYDIEDFFRYHWDTYQSDWLRDGRRFSLEQARCLYAPEGGSDSSWHPLDYARDNPYVMACCPDSVFYFMPVIANASRFGLETPFQKSYPQALKPPYSDPEEVPRELRSVYLTENGLFKFYEYEFMIENLLPRRPYWVTVTAFDYGSPASTLSSFESPISSRAVRFEPLYGPGCCAGTVGNVDCDEGDEVRLSDIVTLIDFLFINGFPPCCWEEADVNLSGVGTVGPEDITVSDVAALIDYLFRDGAPPQNCPPSVPE